MDPRLSTFRYSPYSSKPRYYPPGQHPATFRERAHLIKLLEVEEKTGGSPDLTASINYLKEKLAAFEEGETEAKYRVLRMLERRDL